MRTTLTYLQENEAESSKPKLRNLPLQRNREDDDELEMFEGYSGDDYDDVASDDDYIMFFSLFSVCFFIYVFNVVCIF